MTTGDDAAAGCLEDHTLVALMEGGLGDDALDRARTHAANCPRCRALLAAVVAERSSPGETAATAPEAEDGPTLFLERGAAVDRYIILEAVGAGAMGVVFSAYHPGLDRRVALKFVRTERYPSGKEEDLRDRLLREARTMARVSHANVLPVYDAGVFRNRVFVAMELIEGQTLRTWARAAPRSWREILDAYRKAGNGLAAAHAAGVVHRDFKPDNVLVSSNGRVLVTDFGLARSTNSDTAANMPYEPLGGVPIDALTRTGTVLGTPAYMAPEQMRGEPATPLADQFSFSAAFFEALHGSLPFPGKTLDALRSQIERGEPTSVSGGARVPPWIRRIVSRGLFADPQRRYPSMEALLEALARDPAVRIRRGIAVGLALAAFFAGAAGLYVSSVAPSASPCAGAEAEIAAVWGPPQKTAVRSALRVAGAPEAVWSAFERIVDQYTREWTAAQTDACEATRVRRVQPETVRARRAQCLLRHRESLHSLVQIYSDPKRQHPERAFNAAFALPRVAACSAVFQGRAEPPRPQSPETQQQTEKLWVRLARMRVLAAAGELKSALAEAKLLVRSAQELADGMLEAEAAYWLGNFHLEQRDFARARPAFEEALHAALAAGHDAAATQVLTDLVFMVGVLQGRREEGWALARRAAMLIERTQDEFQLAVLVYYGGIFLFEAGDFAAARDAFTSSLAIHERLGEGQWIGFLLNAMGRLERRSGRYHEARGFYERGLRLEQEIRGPESRESGILLMNLAGVEEELGRCEVALALQRQSLKIAERVRGPESTDTAIVLSNIGSHQGCLGDFRAGLTTARRARSLLQRSLGKEHRVVANTLAIEAELLAGLGHYEEAIAGLQQALAFRVKTSGERHPGTAEAWIALSTVWLAAGNGERALTAAEHAQRLVEPLSSSHLVRVAASMAVCAARCELGQYASARQSCQGAMRAAAPFGEGHPTVIQGQLLRAEIGMGEKNPAAALPLLERAIAILQGRGGARVLGARIRFALARALRMSGSDERRAVQLAQEARAVWRAVGSRDRRPLERIDRWLAQARK